jgi:ABC-type multidrug transport system fused ATPase/permease subunit
MGFIMDGLESEAYDRNYADRELVRRIINYFRPESSRMVVVSIAVVLNSLSEIALPIFVSLSLDSLQKDTFNPFTAALILSVIASLGWLFNFFRQWLSAEAVGNVTLQLREDAFNSVTERDMSFYDQFPSGKIVSRVTSDTQAFSEVVRLSINLISQILLIFILIGYLFFVNWQLTLVLLTIAPFIIFTALQFRRIARTTVTNSRRIFATVNAHVQETISGIGVAKAFRREQMVYEEFEEVNKKAYSINLRTGYTFGSIFPILNAIAGIGTGALVWFGVQLAQTGTFSIFGFELGSNIQLTAGEWYLFIQGMSMFWFPLTSIASFWSQFQMGLAAGERVFALLDADSKIIQTDNQRLDKINGEIRFENVDFSYVEGESVLKNFSLTIAAGETVAMVGHTGSGKSSVTKLINRFYEYQNGNIYIDGHDIRTLNLQSYRQKVGVVTQSSFLFDGTLMDNIRYGKFDAPDEEVIAVSKQVGGGDWLISLPSGLATEVGERGSSLSMGQRQLVALARVLIQNPRIFILDEATASVDPLTEALIQEGLDTVLQGRTSIVVAHRLSTIKNADRIIVLREGEIIEEGSHDSLMASAGHYAELYNTYFRHQSLEYIESAAD